MNENKEQDQAKYDKEYMETKLKCREMHKKIKNPQVKINLVNYHTIMQRIEETYKQ